ncbi:fluoride efflux transporter CrcB [Mycobacterium sp. 141]|uniref:fluoride efflux transporter CrcB n=1 Tax=Mycobacterium sp. 141 TaxID=1120797 RepID=UPI00035E765E|nr:fluoride efflux transporter CrcB [Mycobacterium sp. 141]
MFGHDNRELAAVFAGGAVGTGLRAVVATVLPAAPGQWPWPTFIVNIAGALLVGYFTTRLLERLPLSSYRRPLLGTGVCGGLTTFSTMQVEIVHMIEAQQYRLAAGYAIVSISVGLVAVHVASVLTRRVQSRGRA